MFSSTVIEDKNNKLKLCENITVEWHRQTCCHWRATTVTYFLETNVYFLLGSNMFNSDADRNVNIRATVLNELRNRRYKLHVPVKFRAV